MTTHQQHLRTLRADYNLTQAQIAAVLGLSEENGGRHIRKIENGTVEASGPLCVLIDIFVEYPAIIEQRIELID